MEVNLIHDWTYAHVYEVKGWNDILLQYKDEIITTFEENKKGVWDKENYNIKFNNKKFNENYNKSMIELLDRYYYLDNIWGVEDPQIYIQDNKSSKNILHNHNQMSIVTTSYIDPLEGDGQLELKVSFSDEDSNLKITPQKDYIYAFPGWMWHRPLPQKNNHKRICLNWGMYTNVRVIHKLNGGRW